MNRLWIAALALTLGAGAALAHDGDGKHDEKAEAAAMTVTGEIVDMNCYMDHAGAGEKHAKCAKMCAQGGAPIGVLGKDGALYLIVADHSDEKAYGEAKAAAGETKKLTGKAVKRGGVQALVVKKVEKP